MRSKKATARLADIEIDDKALREIKREKKRRSLEVGDVADAIETSMAKMGVNFGVAFDTSYDKVTLADFEDALQVDRDDLDSAVQEQPSLLYHVGQKLALQVSRRDAAKSYLATQEAQTDAQLRRAGRNNEQRLTDKAIEAMRRVSSNVVKANDQLLQLEHSVRQWQVMSNAVVARGHALRDLVTLYVHEHYQTSSISGASTMRDLDADRARRAMNAKRRSGQ